ncbi:MAG: hypothetical protein K0B11_08140 [Mariniphaga sp.]|nr:hypothetical protein [Mariniphaga sp.]
MKYVWFFRIILSGFLFVIISTSCVKEGPIGLPGKDGIDGKDGKDGQDGKDGKDGVFVQIPPIPPLETQARVQVAFDDYEVAFKFTWKSQQKKMPAGFASEGQNYPGQFHDILKHNGTKFDRLPSGERLEEDRITFMIDKYESEIPFFGKAGCAVSCHAEMTSHHLLSDNILDHWHWRGGRSGPMGYAEDAAVNNVGRIRDNLGTPPTKFIRSGGDRLREDQAALAGSAHPVLSDGLPRFVFNKGKLLPGNYVVPSYFLTNSGNQIITDPYTGIPAVKDVSKNRSLMVVYQDPWFDNENKVNALDLAYLVWAATSEVGHLPAHLQDTGTPDFTVWKNFWASQSGISPDDSAAALAKLDDVHAEWVASDKNAMVTRSVGFIYSSDQHDISSTRSYDTARNEWSVVLTRRLTTGSNRDADLSDLENGTPYTIAFAMHDEGGGEITHNRALPVTISTDDDVADLLAKKVNYLGGVNWREIPAYDTYWVDQSHTANFNYEFLTGSQHPGSGSLATMNCVDCHNNENSLLTSGLLN